MTEFEVRPMNINDFPELEKVFKCEYPNNLKLREKSYFDWQFLNSPYNPCPGEYCFYVATAKDEIFGFAGGIPTPYSFAGKTLQACQVVNLNSRFRMSTTAGLNLLSHLKSKYDMLMYSNLTPDAIKLYRAMKLPLIEDINRWFLIMDKEKVSRDLQVQDDMFFDDLVASSFERFSAPKSEYVVVDRFSDDRVPKIVWDAKYSILPEGKYLNWRYVDIPNHRYICVENGSEHAVFRFEKVKGSESYVLKILEWNIKRGEEIGVFSLLREFDEFQNTIMMEIFCGLERVGRALESIGFRSERQVGFGTLPMLYRPNYWRNGYSMSCDFNNPSYKSLFDYNESYLTSGEGDIDRVKN